LPPQIAARVALSTLSTDATWPIGRDDEAKP